MVTVDSEGRIAIPEDLREQLDLATGREVELRVEGKHLIVEPKQDPEEFWQEHLSLIKEADEHERERSALTYEELDVISQDFTDTVRKEAGREAEGSHERKE